MSSVFVRLSIFWENQQLDVSLPAQRPVVDFIDEIIQLFHPVTESHAKPGESVTDVFTWALSSPINGRINPDISLSESGIIDGQRLYLTQASDAAQAPFVDDILSEIRTTIDDNQWRWSSAIRSNGLYCCGLTLLGLLFLILLPRTLTPTSQTSPWVFAPIGIITLTSIIIAASRPHPWLRWAGIITPIAAAAATWPATTLIPNATTPARITWTLAATSLGGIIAAFLAGRRRPNQQGQGADSRNDTAGVVAFTILTVVLTGLGVAFLFPVRPLAVAAWGAWAPILLLLIAPTVALNATGLPTMLRRNDTGDPVERTKIHTTARRSEAFSRGLVWAATALALLDIITLVGSPYWQQAIPAACLALILMLRSHGFADARIIAPLLTAGGVGIALTATALTHFGQHHWSKPPAPWWQADNYLVWVVFASTLIVIALLFISINNLSLDELQEARLSKIISTIDVLISLTFVPGILVAQGVYTYFWAIM